MNSRSFNHQKQCLKKSYRYKFDYHLDLSFHKQGDYKRNYIRTGLGYGIFYQDYELTLNCGIKDISVGEKFSFDVIKEYNIKYTYGVLIKFKTISFSFSGYRSFIPMPLFNSYNGTFSFEMQALLSKIQLIWPKLNISTLSSR